MAQAITLTDTELEVFGIGVLEAYQHRDYFQEDWALFQGMTAGEVVNVPVMQEGVATNLADGSAHTSGNAQMIGNEIPLVDPIKSFTDILKTQVDIRPDLNLLTTVGRQVGRDVGFGRTIRIANHLAFQADANSQTDVRDYITASVLAANVIEGVKAVAESFDEAGVDSEMRFGMMKPTLFYAVRGEAEVISSDFTQGQNINQVIGGNMSMVNYLGFTIRNMGGIFGIDWTASSHGPKNLPTTTGSEMAFDMSAVMAIFWQHDSWAARHQTGLETNVDWIHRDQVWMPIARLHMGIKVIKIDGLFILVDNSA